MLRSIGIPDPATDRAERIAELWDVFLWAGAAVAAIVLGLLLWAVLRYRARGREELPDQTHGVVPLEVVWTAIPLVIVVALFALTYGVERDVDEVSGPADVELEVTGFNWQWRFVYPELGVTVIGTREERPVVMLPAGRTVRFHLTSADVIHSFFVPGFLFKRDAVPGRVTTFDVVPRRLGDFDGECAEFCGLNHAYMGFTVRVVPGDEFDTWAASAAEPTTIPSPA